MYSWAFPKGQQKKTDGNKTKRTIGSGKHSLKYGLVVFTDIEDV
jgi:hypothetical protein